MQSSDNILLLKSAIGKTRPGIHRLPPPTFVYGKCTGEDKEGARALMRIWKLHEPSKLLPTEPDYKLLNSMSVQNGLSTSTQFRLYRKGKNVRTVSDNTVCAKTPENRTFGMALRPATPIKAVISNFYGRVASDCKHEEYSEQQVQMNLKYGSTKGFELLKASKLKGLEARSSEFKMRKFNGVRTRTDCWRK